MINNMIHQQNARVQGTNTHANLMDEIACRIAMALKPKVDGMPTPTSVGFLMTNMDHSSTEISGPCTPLVNICYSKQYMLGCPPSQ